MDQQGLQAFVTEHVRLPHLRPLPPPRVWTPGAPRPLGTGHDPRLSPGWPLFATELHRGAAEYAGYVATGRLLRTLAPRGKGQPVLVLPGLMAGDATTRPLRGFLKRLGYRPHGWRLGRNIGPTLRVRTALSEVLADAVERYEQPVTLIGWSLGGIFARELARENPEQVVQVITLGTPFRLSHPSQTRAMRAFDRYSHLHVPVDQLPPPENGREPLPVPSTSIYSECDGIVSWRACLEEASDTRENVAVYSSHVGLGHHPAVLWAIADRLSQPAGTWRPFRAPAWAGPLFPTPAHYVPVMV